jgi:hypothetical protein
MFGEQLPTKRSSVEFRFCVRNTLDALRTSSQKKASSTLKIPRNSSRSFVGPSRARSRSPTHRTYVQPLRSWIAWCRRSKVRSNRVGQCIHKVKGQTEGELARIDISTPSQVAESDKKIPLPTVSGPPGVVVMQGKTIESALRWARRWHTIVQNLPRFLNLALMMLDPCCLYAVLGLLFFSSVQSVAGQNIPNPVPLINSPLSPTSGCSRQRGIHSYSARLRVCVWIQR